ncbi:response regulator transcription factor [Ornithinimicrobium faecis]|uniref:Response regulator transcription factor n=1 Tax=Ornithinimicrobium faecis TaxID=2934158 RepID=A0ABY4YUG1_9MICO|nr:response regulator transcription factor [Ornithinimicrobium sp. HY1793]USQ80409.1 response regulator transcription factor [Ornithinimicrobium sp. HY1793]
MPTRILIADDQADVRSGFRLVLDSQPDMSVVGEAADGAAAVRLARQLRPDVVLADIRMPLLDGLEVTRQLSAETRVIVVTTLGVERDARTALQHGACGFILKRSGPTLLIEAVRSAMSGDTLISPQLTVSLLKDVSTPTHLDEPADLLTAREREIAALVARGLTNAEIADELFITAGTVKTHVANIQTKVGSRNRVGIAAWAWRAGLVRP